MMNLRLLDSVNLAFTVISSGGFVPSNNLSNIFIPLAVFNFLYCNFINVHIMFY